MKSELVGGRNAVIHSLYKSVLKPIFFLQDPENVHDRMVHIGSVLGRTAVTRAMLGSLFGYSDPRLEQEILGIKFKNPIGLAAGFDKNAELTSTISAVGFGHIEVGSITGNPCVGNPKPRLWRLKQSQGLVVYFGLKNDGAEVLAARLREKHFTIPVGTSVAMTNCPNNLNSMNAVKDYEKAFKAFAEIGDYTTVNISCPNAEGGQPFILPHKLDYLLDILDKVPTKKPIFIKLSPDLKTEQIDELLDVVNRHRIQGIICSNLTKRRDNPNIAETDLPKVGGISGKPVQEQADKLLSYIYRKEGRKYVLVGLGGVFTAEDAYRKIRLGASLVQLVTGMIFEGPQVISEINRGLVSLLKRDGFRNISDAIGVDNKS